MTTPTDLRPPRASARPERDEQSLVLLERSIAVVPLLAVALLAMAR